jgi:hypothetical protein
MAVDGHERQTKIEKKIITQKLRSITHDNVNGCNDKDATFVAGSEKKNGSIIRVYSPKGRRCRLSLYVNLKPGVVSALQ